MGVWTPWTPSKRALERALQTHAIDAINALVHIHQTRAINVVDTLTVARAISAINALTCLRGACKGIDGVNCVLLRGVFEVVLLMAEPLIFTLFTVWYQEKFGKI